MSAPFETRQLLIVRLPADWPLDWHLSPKRQIWIGVQGGLRVTVSDGETRTLPAGTLLFMEDVTGKGHATVPLNGQAVIGAIARLE